MAKSTLRRPNASPLRYPGGKSVLFPLVSELLELNDTLGGTYVEPYAGGAGVALGLLLTEQVERIVINDLDPAIYAFWKAVTEKGDEFADRIGSVELTPSEWSNQKAIYKAGQAASGMDLGFATFYLNRTNRSGVLNAGMIGGRAQTGTYKIDARFNRVALAEKCRLISLYSPRIVVRCQDGIDLIEEFVDEPRTLVYADPPYFEKGSQLYLNSFLPEDHERLATCLNARSDSSWMLTYDNARFISDLYPSRRQSELDIRYSVTTSREAKELLIVSDALSLPRSE